MIPLQKNSLTSAILKTLCYADVFDYPMTKDELFQYLISGKKVAKDILFQFLDTHILGVAKDKEFFFLVGKKSLVIERKKRRIESIKKMEKAKRISDLLSFIPTIKFIGVSGSLSMNNSKRNDDIDLFIITKCGKLWITRFLILITLSFIGERRKRRDLLVVNKICPNMFLDEENLALDFQNRNLYTAHEVVQLKPLFNRNNTYEKFLSENHWVSRFLPNAARTKSRYKTFSKVANLKKTAFSNFLYLFELIFFTAQYLYMKSGITSEKINLSSVMFHPRDIKSYVLQLYSLKYKHISKLHFYQKKQEYSRILT